MPVPRSVSLPSLRKCAVEVVISTLAHRDCASWVLLTLSRSRLRHLYPESRAFRAGRMQIL